MAQIRINNLSYKNIINNLNVVIGSSSWVSVIGNGKTTLAKLLIGELDSDGLININNTVIDKYNIRDLHNTVYYLDHDSDMSFVSSTVLGNILFAMTGYSNYMQDKRLQALVDYFEIADLLYKNPNNLSGGQKELIAFVSTIILNPQVLIIDDSFSLMDGLTKKRVYSLLKRYVEQGMILINMVSDSDDLMYSDGIIVLDKNISIIRKEDLANEHILKNIGYNLPFVLDLSNKLKYYKMIDRYYVDTSKLVNAIWK